MERMALDSMSRRVAAAGEPFRTSFDPAALRTMVARRGFRLVDDLGCDELNARYFTARADGLRIRGGLGRILSAEI
jgi:O-methyltransferase involved in polyketide biosynthesis